MSRQIIKQPNGKYCVFSSIVDNVIMYNATPEAIINKWAAEQKGRIEIEVKAITEQLENGQQPYYQFTFSFDQMISFIKDIHGEKEAAEINQLINK